MSLFKCSASFVQPVASSHSYLSRCPVELQARNLNYWIEQEYKHRETLFCRFDANRLRAVFTERYTAIDHMEVMTKILENGFDPAGEIQFALDDEMMILKMPEYEKAFHLAGNDKIIPGISIANSEVGILALSIEAFFLEQGATMFHVIQAFTRAAQDGRLSATDTYRLERAGGQILNLVGR